MIPLAFCCDVFGLAARSLLHTFKSQVRAFKHLVESVHDAVAKYTSTGDLTYLSHTAESFFGCKRYELAGSGFVERIHVLDRPGYLKALDEARVKGKPPQRGNANAVSARRSIQFCLGRSLLVTCAGETAKRAGGA